MTFHGKPSGGPDAVGGLFPRSEIQPFRSRAGAALAQGAVVVMDLTASAGEVDASDSNVGLPGAGDSTDDTIWNTVVDPVVLTHVGSNVAPTAPALFGVVLPAVGIADNAIGKVQIHGIVDQARCLSTGGTNLVYGTPLTATSTNSFNATIASNARIIGFYCGETNTVTNLAELGRVMLHNGVGFGGAAAIVA
jgi:hypothetical protein